MSFNLCVDELPDDERLISSSGSQARRLTSNQSESPGLRPG